MLKKYCEIVRGYCCSSSGRPATCTTSATTIASSLASHITPVFRRTSLPRVCHAPLNPFTVRLSYVTGSQIDHPVLLLGRCVTSPGFFEGQDTWPRFRYRLQSPPNDVACTFIKKLATNLPPPRSGSVWTHEQAATANE